MNRKQWTEACNKDWNSVDHTFDYKSRLIQKSLKYNPDPNATVRHHLMDTPEQIAYNREHYEMWGYNLDGTFEYGKYMIFVTAEEHLKLHAVCEDTRKKISISQKFRLSKKDARFGRLFKKGNIPWNKGKSLADGTKLKISISRKGKCAGEDHPFYGKHHTEETILKIKNTVNTYWSNDENRKQQSERCKGRKQSPEHVAKRVASLIGHETSEETRRKISEANSGREFSEEHKRKLSIARQQRIITDETKEKTSVAMKEVMSNEEHRKRISETVSKQKQAKKLLYNEYRAVGGTLLWNDFQSFLKNNFERNYVPTLSQLQEALSSPDDEDSDDSN